MIYVASKTRHATMWRAYRAKYPIISSWIDEAEAGQTADFGELWVRIKKEIRRSKALILYVEPDDAVTLKGALIEVGMALECDIPVIVCAHKISLDGLTLRPLGSWVKHPLVTLIQTLRPLDTAFELVMKHLRDSEPF